MFSNVYESIACFVLFTLFMTAVPLLLIW